MIVNPRYGHVVQVWYRASVRDIMPLHGKLGGVEIVGRGRPRNHGVKIDGRGYVIPCGNLRKPPTATLCPAEGCGAGEKILETA